MPRARTTKGLAKRISLDYFKRAHPLRTLGRRLSLAAAGPALGIVLLAIVATITGRPSVIRGAAKLVSPGPVSQAHAFIGADCARCHGPASGGSILLKVDEARCLGCHDTGRHSERQEFTPACSD